MESKYFDQIFFIIQAKKRQVRLKIIKNNQGDKPNTKKQDKKHMYKSKQDKTKKNLDKTRKN